MLFKKWALGSLMTAASVAGAEELKSLSFADAQLNAAQIRAVFPLEKSKAGSRVSLVVGDLGGSTDVSPRLALYLAFRKDGEWGNVSSAYKIADVFKILDYRDNQHGEVSIDIPTGLSIHDPNERIVIDYASFLREVDKPYLQDEAQDKWLNGRILYRVLD